jgi:glycosyltransferase involved in cell wall biosynthesis
MSANINKVYLKNMNILHLTHTDTRYDSRILKELGALADTGLYNVNCIGVASEEGASHSKNELNATIIIIRLAKISSRIPRPIRHTIMLIELYIRLFILGIKIKPDIVHCHDTMVLPAGAFIKRYTKAKLIYDAHELESNKNGQTKILSKATLYIEKKYWSKIDHLISVSSSIISWYETNVGVKPNSLILNSPAINVSDTTSNRYFHNLYNIPHDKLVFVYLGLFGHGRAIETILESFSSENINSHVVFVGYGELGNKIKDASQRRSNIHLHNPVPHEEVVSLVRNADIGLCLIENVSLSDYYCLPNKLFEYSFAGLPVLASNFPDIHEIVEQFALGRCCDLDSSSIADAIAEMEKNMPKRITTNLTELGWQTQAERLVGIYKNLAL